MIERIATKFIEIQYNKGIIQKDDINIYRYGYILMLEVFMNICFTFVLGVLLGSIFETIFFLCMFAPLRSVCGGYHADKVWKCNILSICAVLFVISVSRLMLHYNISEYTQILVMIILDILIVMLAPVDNQNRRLNIKEKKVLKRFVGLVLIIEMVIDIVLIQKRKTVYCYIVIMTQIVQFISIIITLSTKYRHANEADISNT